VHSLADKQHIYGAKVEFVEVRESCETVIGRVLAGIKLLRISMSMHLT